MEEKKITIDVFEDGQIHATTDGFVGTECVTELDRLMKDIARNVTRKKKNEYFQEKISNDTKVKVKND
ncbi:MAG: DUF2997 domain-containing protein [Clostridia bacterium]|nr:DUF2997 domain-containing protein [Clostridia bacterium]